QKLPLDAKPLVGREREVALARDLLRREDTRLLTITGPGGVGKTRLAGRVAAELLGDFADGVYFVPLAPLRDASLVAPTIAHAVGARQTRLADYLGARPALLVLACFERDVV